MAISQIRRRGRERALQFLFGLDFTGNESGPALDLFWKDNPVKPGTRQYAEMLISGVLDHQDELDGEIASVLDNWTPERIGRIERNIIRIALYEMRFCKDVPIGVAISEALEVARRFGSDEAPRFVNGVLGRLIPPQTQVEP